MKEEYVPSGYAQMVTEQPMEKIQKELDRLQNLILKERRERADEIRQARYERERMYRSIYR